MTNFDLKNCQSSKTRYSAIGTNGSRPKVKRNVANGRINVKLLHHQSDNQGIVLIIYFSIHLPSTHDFTLHRCHRRHDSLLTIKLARLRHQGHKLHATLDSSLATGGGESWLLCFQNAMPYSLVTNQINTEKSRTN
jgi:hypothetical protein